MELKHIRNAATLVYQTKKILMVEKSREREKIEFVNTSVSIEDKRQNLLLCCADTTKLLSHIQLHFLFMLR